jgi:hypothetical protein
VQSRPGRVDLDPVWQLTLDAAKRKGLRVAFRVQLSNQSTDEDFADLRTMGLGLKAAGTRVIMFDDVQDPDAPDPTKHRREADLAREAGIEVVKVSPILSASPDRARFACLDHIHMTEPYHRLMAKEWLRVILGVPLSAN